MQSMVSGHDDDLARATVAGESGFNIVIRRLSLGRVGDGEGPSGFASGGRGGICPGIFSMPSGIEDDDSVV